MPAPMAFTRDRNVVDPANCDLITYLAASVGVSELEALDRLGDCLLEHSGLHPWATADAHVFKMSSQPYGDSAPLRR